MKKISLLFASLCALFLVACSNQKQADGKLNIVTTFYPVYEFTKQVAGDTANVELLIGAGTCLLYTSRRNQDNSNSGNSRRNP